MAILDICAVDEDLVSRYANSEYIKLFKDDADRIIQNVVTPTLENQTDQINPAYGVRATFSVSLLDWSTFDYGAIVKSHTWV